MSRDTGDTRVAAAPPFHLQPLSVAQQVYLPRGVFDATLSVDRSDPVAFTTDQLVARVAARVYAHQIADEKVTDRRTVTWEVPASTWQMFKARNARRRLIGWLVARHPVRTVTHRETVTLTCHWTGYQTFPDLALDRSRIPDVFGAPVPVSYVTTTRPIEVHRDR